MRKKIKLLIIGFTITILSTNIFLSQSTDATDYSPKIMPASPEAFKFGSYGNVPVGLFTGAPNINIPLATFNMDDINIPVSLSYSSNGIKLDEMNGSVGLGWSLIGAGVITRTVRDLPDENSAEIIPTPNIDVLGLWSPAVVNYINDAQQEGADSEPDMYMANFAGNSIRFVFDRNGKPFLYTKSNFQIIGQSGGESFTIISDKGVQYEFAAKERTLFRTQGGGHSVPTMYNSSWYLTKITSNKKEINVEYYESGYSTTLSQSQTMIYTPPGAVQYKLVSIDMNGTSACVPQMYTVPASINNNRISSTQNLFGQQIKRIYYNDASGNPIQEMIFNYEALGNNDFKPLQSLIYKSGTNEILNSNFEYTTTANGRMFLKSITNTKDNGKYEFEYINKDQLPKRLSATSDVSASRDIWGLYNGKSNNTLIPQIFDPNDPNRVVYNGADQSFDGTKANSGLLNKIIYPTKGSTEIVYEPHTRKETKIIPGTKDWIRLQVSSTYDTNMAVTQTITITPTKDEFIMLSVPNATRSPACDPTLDEGKTKGNLAIKDNNNQFIPIYTYSPTVNAYIIYTSTSLEINTNMAYNYYYIQLKKDVPLTFTLKTMWFCTDTSMSFYYTVGQDTTQQVDAPFGGFRVASTTDTPISGSPITKTFSYSGINVLRKPYFLESHEDRSYCGTSGAYNPLTYYSLTSNNLAQLNATSPNIFYETVIEEQSGKGKIIHTFDISSDYFGKDLIGKPILSSPWTNFGWNNGREKNTVYRDVSNNLLKEVKYNYVEDNSRKTYVDAISVRKNFDLQYSGNVTMTCTADNINTVHHQYYCNANHTHVWHTWDDTCHGNGHIDVWVTFYGYCYGHNIGDVVVKPNIFENLDVVQYKNISHFDYLQSQKTTDYLNGNPIQTTTEYFYNNPAHYQLTDQKTTFPDSTLQETTYQYAQEKNKTKLIESNMVGIPLETIVVKKQSDTDSGKTISKTYTDYPDTLPDVQTGNLLLPKSVSALDLITGNMSTEVTYDQYDTKGNVQQYTTKDGVSTAIVWGYNQTQPIAKIEGAMYSQVSGLATGIIDASNADANDAAVGNPKEQDLVNALDTFRAALPNYQVTTYSYDPLIGVRSITPPSGIREVYIYDTANRLKEVKDVNGNILKSYEYHYKP
ncbi:MAG: hypothetical protein E2590_05570 [Chryseobacterium sp.]|nr:hypothetical protein [Chryseobacterium sp.]